MADLLINSTSTIVLCLICSFFCWLLYHANRGIPGVGLWALGTSIFSLALLLFSTQQSTPTWLGVIITNHLFLMAMLLQLGGIFAFFKRKYQRVPLFCGIALFSVLYVYFTYLQPNVQVRIIIFNITYMVINGLIIMTIIRYKQNHYKVAASLFYVVIGAGITLIAYRLTSVLCVELHNNSSFNIIMIQLMDGIPFFICFAMIFCFFLLCNEKQYLYIQKLQREAVDIADKEKKLLAFLSHEFRTPLNAIVGKAQLLAKELDDPKARYDCELIAEAGQSLSMINQHILRQAEAEHNSIADSTSSQLIELRPWLQRFLDTFRHLAQAKGLTLALFVTEKAPQQVMINSVALRQVLTNLLSNAIKYSDSGTVKLSIEPANTNANYRISISDQGIGIPLHEQEKVLQPFGRAWQSLQQEGSGLGLALTQQLLHTMGTELTFSSNTDKGCSFYFSLQLPAVEQPKLTPQATTETSLAPLRILVVEDAPLNQQVISGMLDYLSHECSMVGTLAQATERLQSESFDLLLLDLNLPDGDGLSFFKQLKKTNPLLPQTCIITADIALETELVCLAAGVKAILHKPVDIKKLQHAILETSRVIQVFNREQFWQLARFIPAHSMLQQLTQLNNETTDILAKLNNPLIRIKTPLIHQLAGKAATLGMPKLAHVCNALTQSNTDITHYLPQLRQHLNEALTALNQEVATKQQNKR